MKSKTYTTKKLFWREIYRYFRWGKPSLRTPEYSLPEKYLLRSTPRLMPHIALLWMLGTTDVVGGFATLKELGQLQNYFHFIDLQV